MPDENPTVQMGDTAGSDTVVCSVNGGPPFTTSRSACLGVPGGKILRKGTADTDPHGAIRAAFIRYTLPSGHEVVGTPDDCATDGGTPVAAISPQQPPATGDEAAGLIVCKLPSGHLVVARRDQCQQDGGTVIGTPSDPVHRQLA